MGDDGDGGTDSLDGMVSSRIVGASASVNFLCTIKSRRWRALETMCITLWSPPHEWVNVSSGTGLPGSSGQRAVKWSCVLLVVSFLLLFCFVFFICFQHIPRSPNKNYGKPAEVSGCLSVPGSV